MSIYDVKQKAIDALGAIDVSKLSVSEAHQYCEALRFLSDIKDDAFFSEAMNTLKESMNTKWEPPKPVTLNDLK